MKKAQMKESEQKKQNKQLKTTNSKQKKAHRKAGMDHL